jgi:hypothetical protein
VCAVEAEAGVVDEDVNGEASAHGCVVELLRRGGVVEVGWDDADFGSLPAEFGGEGFKAVCAASGEDELCAV